MCKGPDWWVKIADFGITKRAADGLTALRTVTGTPAFIAPEVLGFVQSAEGSDNSYTNAVDIWSVGVISYLILTAENLFQDQRRLGQYVSGSYTLPVPKLLANGVSEQGCDFIQRSLAPKPENRLETKASLKHPWLSMSIEVNNYEHKGNGLYD